MKIIEGQIEIYFDDLNEECKKEFLRAMALEKSAEGNYDIFPIAIVPIKNRSNETIEIAGNDILKDNDIFIIG